jgi:hypothetical protein
MRKAAEEAEAKLVPVDYFATPQERQPSTVSRTSKKEKTASIARSPEEQKKPPSKVLPVVRSPDVKSNEHVKSNERITRLHEKDPPPKSLELKTCSI